MTDVSTNGGKADGLVTLTSISGISVPSFTVMPATLSHAECESLVTAFLHNNPHVTEVAVRSSAPHEDSSRASFAGMYTTKLHVPANAEAIMEAVVDVRDAARQKEAVAAQYSAQRGVSVSEHAVAVIVQKMLHPERAGVIFSHSLHARDGYYLVSVTQGLGEAIASGSTNGQLVRVARAIDPAAIKQQWLADLVRTMQLIERNFGSKNLDVEFAFEDKKLYILQCRPITTNPHVLVGPHLEARLVEQLVELKEDVATRYAGDILGDMIDINPAELLGSAPTPLDVSVFRYLFGDRVVEEARRDMGYDPLDVGLVRIVGGKVYVSLRASAYSFRPRGIPETTYEKLFGVYRQMLVDDPGLHTRVEFAVFAMQTGDKLEHVMARASLEESEKRTVRAAYCELESSIEAAARACAASLSVWTAEYRTALETMQDDLHALLAHVQRGTRQFVRVARFAFFWKNRFEESHPGDDLNTLLSGRISTISGRLQRDLWLCRNGRLEKSELVVRYGHLRPGQFSMFGESYADDPDHYLFDRIDSVTEPSANTEKQGDDGELANVIVFMQAREEVKFLFSRALDAFIAALRAAIDQCGITRTVASRYELQELEALLRGNAIQGESSANLIPMILPEVLIPGDDLRVVVSHATAATYITKSVVKARLCVLSDTDGREDVAGAIVLIPHADPGYDYLFHSGALGIITMRGGPASHMCIRAVELGMPACVGCGEQLYTTLSSAHVVTLDCQSGQIIVAQ